MRIRLIPPIGAELASRGSVPSAISSASVYPSPSESGAGTTTVRIT